MLCLSEYRNEQRGDCCCKTTDRQGEAGGITQAGVLSSYLVWLYVYNIILLEIIIWRIDNIGIVQI